MNISIFGLGYVGAVSAACLARDGHRVVGCDIDPNKLELIRSGRTPIIEEGMADLMSAVVSGGNLTVTDDVRVALLESDLSFICVGTPSLPNGGQDLTAVNRLCEQLGEALRAKGGYHLLVVRSTVLPGTVLGTIKPLIEQHSGLVAGDGFGLCFQPEFLREGSSIRDYDNPPFTVVGVDTERAAQMLRELFGDLPCDFIVTDVATAEMLKYCCNTFHALKITFANEVGRICQALNLDSHAVMELVCRDRQLNISPAYLRPGFAFGGSCLPKDVKALLHVAKRRDVEIPMLGGIMASNGIHVHHAIETVMRSGKRSIGQLGLSFKTGTDDLRESPLVTMAEHFIGKGLDLKIHDPAVQIARLFGANRRFIEESIPHISSLMRETPAEVIRESDVVIVGIGGKSVLESVYEHTRDDQLVLDLIQIPERERVRGTYVGACW